MNEVAVVCTARPSYSKLRPVIQGLVALNAIPTLYMTNGALLARTGAVIDQARQEFPQCEVVKVYAELDGYTLETSAKSTAMLLASLADAFAWRRPKVVVVNHDRREVLAAAQAAAYQNIPVAHLGGGERSGNIDDRVRDAVSCLATYHFPATAKAATRLHAFMHGGWVFDYGCPSMDQACKALTGPPVTAAELGGAGASVNPEHLFVLVLQHARTEEPEEAFRQMQTTLNAVRATGYPAIVLWPGIDAGADGASKAIRLHQDHVHTVRTLPPTRFLRLMAQAMVMVGNSSAGIRESAYLGVSVVNIGERQHGRECADNVLTVPHDFDAIRVAIQQQVGRVYRRSTLYGAGDAGPRIAAELANRP